MSLKPQIAFSKSVIYSYSQIFFSKNIVVGLIILTVTFMEPHSGFTGLCMIICSNILAHIFGMEKHKINEGYFGFNSLLIGIALGAEYKINYLLLALLPLASFLSFILTVSLSHLFEAKKLPILTFPFVFSYWFLHLASVSMVNLELRDEHIYELNYLAKNNSDYWFQLVHIADSFSLPDVLHLLLQTLSSTFFVHSMLGGLLLLVALVYHSRISFVLTLLGFISAYITATLMGFPMSLLTDSLYGSNFIFMAIAIGGFFLIPDKWSVLAVVILTPILFISLMAMHNFFSIFQLKTFTLSFSVITVLFLYILKNRWFKTRFTEPEIYFSTPELAVYRNNNLKERFRFSELAKINLPFFGFWKISQGYDGGITHLDLWSKALDFVIEDNNQKTWNGNGLAAQDFYCFDKPICACDYGYVYETVNYIEENTIGDVNIYKNWGNCIVINHNNGLYSLYAHLKKDSIRVKVGDYVERGSIIAACGNSGRSPEPHLHFQLQLSPEIGAPAFPYLIHSFVKRKDNQLSLHFYETPEENETVCNIEADSVLESTFDLKPGKQILWKNDQTSEVINWEVKTNGWNQTYIHCLKTDAILYFSKEPTLFYCYDFYGNQNSLLFSFYKTCYKVILGYYPFFKVKDTLSNEFHQSKFVRFTQDLIAPLFLFLKVEFTQEQRKNRECTELLSSIYHNAFTSTIKKEEYILSIGHSRFSKIEIKKDKQQYNWTCIK